MRRALALLLALLAGAGLAVLITSLPSSSTSAATAAAAATTGTQATTTQTTTTVPTTTGADGGATWQFAGAQAPPPPDGQQPSPYPAALGQVGDIEFWSPNEGLLITGGTALVPAGLYAYDGSTWHELSSVCGSGEGRIAYVSADEWWTISDQLPGQTLITGGASPTAALAGISLCHFVNGKVVASYGMPLNQANSYPQMDAAACEGPSDCWFAGNFSSSGNGGSFHLSWNGSTLTEVDDTTEPAATTSLATLGPTMYESVQLPTSTTSTSETVPLHTVVPTDSSNPFHDVVVENNNCTGFCPALPDYGSTVGGTQIQPNALDAFELSSDGSATGDPASPAQMWAVADRENTNAGVLAHPIVLLDTPSTGGWSQIMPAPGGSTEVAPTGFPDGEQPLGVAADPAGNAAWITIAPGSGGTDTSSGAMVALLQSTDGGNTWAFTEQDVLGPQQNLGNLGTPGPITCPAAHDCWLATSQGWLFHLSNGTPLPQSSDPIYNGTDGIIDFRPSDASTLVLQQATTPPDDSLANQQAAQTITGSSVDGGTDTGTTTATTAAKPLISSQKLAFDKKTNTITVTFTLTAKAKVQLVASRLEHLYKDKREKVKVTEKIKVKKRIKVHGKLKVKTVTEKHRVTKVEVKKIPTKKTKTITVAKSKLQPLKTGKHSIKLKLDPKKWPTSVKLNIPGTAPSKPGKSSTTGTNTDTTNTDTSTDASGSTGSSQ